ncbi:MAG: flagellar export chaperone FliS [Porticoccus sp.]
MNQMSALNLYKNIGVQTSIMDSTPHHLITMLMEGVLDRVASARGAISRSEISRKGELISSAIAIIDSLRANLDYDKGGEISVNLGSLYDYIERRLMEANTTSDVTVLDEVSSLIKEIKAGWASIPSDVRKV